MSTTIAELKQLTVTERIQLVEELWDTIAEDSPVVALTPNHIAELDRRLDLLEAAPQGGTPWELVRERMVAKL